MRHLGGTEALDFPASTPGTHSVCGRPGKGCVRVRGGLLEVMEGDEGDLALGLSELCRRR